MAIDEENGYATLCQQLGTLRHTCLIQGWEEFGNRHCLSLCIRSGLRIRSGDCYSHRA